ncbi:hypothetical protein FOXB_16562, partial [Fusarium oxysporum f. sp. conglutinans Fo5176]
MRFLTIASALWLALCPSVRAQDPTPQDPSPQNQSSQASGTLSLDSDQAPFTFEYSTDRPNPANWIGLYYSAGGGPVDQEKGSSNSIEWKYAPRAQGSIQLDSSSLEPGNYTAFFLANGGYTWLAEPLQVIKSREFGGDVSFIVSNVELPNARVGDRYSYSIRGLVHGGNSDVRFSSEGSSDWISINNDGVISGTPTSSGKATIRVRATGANSTASAFFTINVAASGSPLLSQLKVLSVNMWNGGTEVTNYHDKQVRFFASSGADVVGIQEDQQGRHVPRLADALGWHYWSSGGDIGVLSKYPITESYGIISGPSRSGGVKISLDDKKQQINFFVAHLGYTPYGPYDTCFNHLPVEKILQHEAQSGRTPQMKATLAGMKNQLAQADDTPVFLVGDFNAPSHLDYVEGLKDKNCGYSGIKWPTSILPEEAGLIDSFRVAHPDPVADQGITWSPIYIWNSGYGKPEPRDRIDFILYKGQGLNVTDSRTVVVDDPKPEPNHRENEWFSDHAAVLSTLFRVVLIGLHDAKPVEYHRQTKSVMQREESINNTGSRDPDALVQPDEFKLQGEQYTRCSVIARGPRSTKKRTSVIWLYGEDLQSKRDRKRVIKLLKCFTARPNLKESMAIVLLAHR